MSRLSKVILITALLLPSLALAGSGDKCFSREDLDRVSLKTGQMHDINSFARNFFEEFGFCPPGRYIAEKLKMFGGPFQIFDMSSSFDNVPHNMSPEERDSYIFYYGDPSGAVTVMIFDSQTGTNYSLGVTDQGNMGQSAAVADQYMLYELQEFVAELRHGADPDTTINKYIGSLAFAPDNESRAKLEIAVRLTLRNICRDMHDESADLQVYAYQLGHLRAAVWESYMDLRDKRLERHLKYR